MSDLLVPAPSIPHLKSLLPTVGTKNTNASLRHTKSTPHLRTSDRKLVVGALSRTFQGAGSLWQSWRDGLTDDEREEQRSKDERRQILHVRIKTVCQMLLCMVEICSSHEILANVHDRLNRTHNGRQRPGNSTPSMATTGGSKTLQAATTSRSLLPSG